MSKILVVDDAKFSRMRLSKLLKENGHEVEEAEDGVKAVQLYREISPDVVFMDITMPNKDGLEALAEIKELDSQAKVIMLTALDQQSVVLQAVLDGAKDFVVKPFDPVKVMESLQKVLR